MNDIVFFKGDIAFEFRSGFWDEIFSWYATFNCQENLGVLVMQSTEWEGGDREQKFAFEQRDLLHHIVCFAECSEQYDLRVSGGRMRRISVKCVDYEKECMIYGHISVEGFEGLWNACCDQIIHLLSPAMVERLNDKQIPWEEAKSIGAVSFLRQTKE